MKSTALLLLSAYALPALSLNTPFTASGRWILDSKGDRFTYAGANWPGAGEAMIPEGLQYAPVKSTLKKIKSIGMNAIRLTFPIELVDDIYEKGEDTTILDSLINALGTENGTAVFKEITTHNPSLTKKSTRLDAYDLVAAESYKQGIHVELDNHISKAMWCCSTTDGNAWFGDTYFNVDNWKRGLEYMAAHAGASWPALTAIGLRNELRQPATANADFPYNWETWYAQMTDAAARVNAANPHALIFLSGLNYDTTLSPIPTGADLGSGSTFNLSSFAFADKLVLELHNYQTTATNCADITGGLYNGGFNALDADNDDVVNVMPVVLTEFGFAQDETTWEGVYASCLRSWIPEQQAGWIVWTISGSYYLRSGTQDMDDTWGILDHTWSDWRNPEAIEDGLKVMVKASV
ncbi:glycoside hydrolase superfamily [Aspergillus pseudoustus]|uniref:Glycoside hydrolase superfamily n=1 Tax=Aspergillus pseudoustus TaxID=1810923 RepID=A0ABR4JBX6_9EURO